MTSFLVDLDSAASNPVDNSAEVTIWLIRFGREGLIRVCWMVLGGRTNWGSRVLGNGLKVEWGFWGVPVFEIFAQVECFELLAMEAVDAVEDGRGHDAQVRSGPYNPYANGYMGSSNGGIRVAALWRRNRVTPINSRDPSGILNFASTTAQEQRWRPHMAGWHSARRRHSPSVCWISTVSNHTRYHAMYRNLVEFWGSYTVTNFPIFVLRVSFATGTRLAAAETRLINFVWTQLSLHPRKKKKKKKTLVLSTVSNSSPVISSVVHLATLFFCRNLHGFETHRADHTLNCVRNQCLPVQIVHRKHHRLCHWGPTLLTDERWLLSLLMRNSAVLYITSKAKEAKSFCAFGVYRHYRTKTTLHWVSMRRMMFIYNENSSRNKFLSMSAYIDNIRMMSWIKDLLPWNDATEMKVTKRIWPYLHQALHWRYWMYQESLLATHSVVSSS